MVWESWRREVLNLHIVYSIKNIVYSIYIVYSI